MSEERIKARAKEKVREKIITAFDQVIEEELKTIAKAPTEEDLLMARQLMTYRDWMAGVFGLLNVYDGKLRLKDRRLILRDKALAQKLGLI